MSATSTDLRAVALALDDLNATTNTAAPAVCFSSGSIVVEDSVGFRIGWLIVVDGEWQFTPDGCSA